MMKPSATASLDPRSRPRRSNGTRRLAEALTRDVASGYVEAIDGEKNRVSLRMPHTGKLLEGTYSEEIEQVLMGARDRLIQIVGSVEVDDKGNPSKILKIQGANEIDARDINVVDVIPECLKPKDGAPCLIIKVDLTADKQFYVARSRELAIFKHASTRAELVDDLEAQLDFLWQQFALLDDDRPCSEDVSEIRRTMREMFREA